MNTKGNENIGHSESELLIADSKFPVDVCHVTIAKASTAETLKRGTVLEAVDTTGVCSVLAGTAGSTASYILAEDVELSTTGTVTAGAYQSGKFVRNALIVADDYAMTAADERALRDAGIYLENAMV